MRKRIKRDNLESEQGSDGRVYVWLDKDCTEGRKGGRCGHLPRSVASPIEEKRQGRKQEKESKQEGEERKERRRQFTITVSPALGQYLEERAIETGLNKSAVVSHALEADREHRKDMLLREGYEEMARELKELQREFEHVHREADQ